MQEKFTNCLRNKRNELCLDENKMLTGKSMISLPVFKYHVHVRIKARITPTPDSVPSAIQISRE